MNQKGVVIYANPWSMIDEKTGKGMEGITVEYLACENLNPVVNEDGSLGVRHCKESIPLSLSPEIKQVPGLYELEFGLKPGTKGKMQVKLVGLRFVSTVGGAQ